MISPKLFKRFPKNTISQSTINLSKDYRVFISTKNFRCRGWLIAFLGLSSVLVLNHSLCHAQAFIKGTDISSLQAMEENGAIYTDNGVPKDALTIFEDNGVNWHRLRIFVDPTGNDPFVVQDIAYTIELAKRAKQNGSSLLLDFHYSDTWADPGKQFKPAAWENLNFTDLKQKVHDYTKNVIEEFDVAGVMPEMVQIGNEIDNGMLWDEGRLWRPAVTENDEFDNLSDLLSAGISGAQAGAGNNQPKIMIHHSQGGNWNTTSYYLDRVLPRLEANGTNVDIIGYSYYPKYHYDPNTGNGDIADLQTNLNNTVNQYNKSVVIVEAGFASRGAMYEPNYEFEVSPTGQKEYLQALVDSLKAVPNNKGEGIFWWYPDARPLDSVQVWEGGRNGLFDANGEKLPALEVFQLENQSSSTFNSSFLNNANATPGSANNAGIYGQGFSPSIDTNPTQNHTASELVSLSTITFFKDANNDNASEIKLAIFDNFYLDLNDLSTERSEFIGISTNTISSTTTLSEGEFYTFDFSDLQLEYGSDYGALFVNEDENGNLIPIKVSALTANYEETSPGSGTYAPTSNYGTSSDYQYATSNYINDSPVGKFLSGFTSGGDARFIAEFDAHLEPILAGDYNQDGLVDAADYTHWRDNFGAVAGTLPNDTTGVPIGEQQYLVWRDNYGNTLSSPDLESVPEPTSNLLALFCFTFNLIHRS